MHLAPTTQMDQLGDLHLDHAAKLTVMAELVEAVHTMHTLGYYHNDLKGPNVMVGGPNSEGVPHVAVIDFGRVLTKTNHTSSHHDANQLRKLIAEVLDCPEKPERSFLECLGKERTMDAASLEAFGDWYKVAHKQGNRHDVGSIYETTFVQRHLPATQEKRYSVEALDD
eukprot:TRINITY_DN15605_c0_g1_i2.p2 TRINITY_DN15605_c0_g1~~TRINITY_DN15605_c0_g1_i2.p2  ORF type:complete len:169 (-),score=31.33 TRINITY_DN15605_c0_g1_i2:138-644(-)